MSHPYIIRLPARGDIADAYEWYEQRRGGRGDQFLDEFYRRLQDVCASPQLFGLVRGRTRAARLPRSRFVIYYRFEANVVVVTAVLHARAHPNRWKRRK